MQLLSTIGAFIQPAATAATQDEFSRRFEPTIDQADLDLASTTLRSGGIFYFVEPERSVFSVEDIAHNLSNVCRFSGRGYFYSVAQHSCHIADLLAGSSREDRYTALMHDAPEFVIGDVIRPLKRILPCYQALEARIEPAIFDRLSVPYPFPESIKQLDVDLSDTEKFFLVPNSERPSRLLLGKLASWSPTKARLEFLSRFDELRPAHDTIPNDVLRGAN